MMAVPDSRLLQLARRPTTMAIMPAGGERILGRRAGRVVERLAVLVCPPLLVEQKLTTSLMRDFTLHLGCLPPAVRHAAGPALRLFDQGARLRPASRGRRFVVLDDEGADAYLRSVLYGRTGPMATMVRLIKSLLVLCYYDLPEVKAALGYDPDTYIAEVKVRRLTLHGSEIRTAEQGGR
jgi:hypothetical protein